MQTLRIDREQACRHLAFLGGADIAHIFAALPDKRDGRPVHIIGVFAHVADRLDALQRDGFGVSVTVNRMKGRRRLKSDLAHVRSVWAERDVPGTVLPLAATLRVRTSQGRGHEYIVCHPDDPLTPTEAERINRVIAREYGADAQACDVARVLRLAGSWHLKREPSKVEIIGGTGQSYSASEIIAAFPAPPPKPSLAPPCIDDRYIAGAVRGVVSDLALAPIGQRNGTLNRAAFRLGKLGLDAERIATVLCEPASIIGLCVHEIRATIRSGARAGAAAAEEARHG